MSVISLIHLYLKKFLIGKCNQFYFEWSSNYTLIWTSIIIYINLKYNYNYNNNSNRNVILFLKVYNLLLPILVTLYYITGLCRYLLISQYIFLCILHLFYKLLNYKLTLINIHYNDYYQNFIIYIFKNCIILLPIHHYVFYFIFSIYFIICLNMMLNYMIFKRLYLNNDT